MPPLLVTWAGVAHLDHIGLLHADTAFVCHLSVDKHGVRCQLNPLAMFGTKLASTATAVLTHH